MQSQSLRFGDGRTIAIQPADSTDITFFAGPTAQVDPVAAVKLAVDSPIEFPPLKHALVEGDTIAIAADPETPELRKVLAGLIEYLREAGADDITVVTVDDGVQTESPIQGANVELHRPDDQDSLSYLAASKEGEPIYVNRTLFDADLVLAVGPVRFDRAPGHYGDLGGLFPQFSDAKTISRFRRPDQNRTTRLHNQRNNEADEATWLLGVQFAIQVAANAANSVHEIVAGHARAVCGESQRHLSGWRFQPKQRAKLVIAGISGDASQQSWPAFSRALAAARQVVEDEGAIVICTELRESVGAGLACLANQSEDTTARDLEQVDSADALSAMLIQDTTDRAHLYLLSEIDPSLVESWGAAPIANASEINRLAQSFQTCIVLQGAQHISVEFNDHASVDLP